MAVRTAPCFWPVDFPDCSAASASMEPIEGSGDPELYAEAAVEYLWNWTGKRFGTCEVTVRPCRSDCDDRGLSTFFGFGSGPWPDGTGAPWRPVIIDGAWYNLTCGRCGEDACGCGRVHSLKLPGPIASIESITIDGEVLPSGNYRVDDNRYLIRLDGEAWPICQDLSAESGTEGTWSVTYRRGIDVPSGGQIAAGVLACELAKAACGDSSCQLPKRVQSITRQGVTIAMLDAFDDIEKGHTGIWLVDSWVASMTKAPTPSRVMSPDHRPRVQRTTWGG